MTPRSVNHVVHAQPPLALACFSHAAPAWERSQVTLSFRCQNCDNTSQGGTRHSACALRREQRPEGFGIDAAIRGCLIQASDNHQRDQHGDRNSSHCAPILFCHVQPPQSAVVACGSLSVLVPVALRKGESSCVECRRYPGRIPAKASVQLDVTPTKWSDRCSRTSRAHFGRSKPRHLLQQQRNAKSARLNAISAVSAIGRATRSQPSFPKFSGVIRCAT